MASKKPQQPPSDKNFRTDSDVRGMIVSHQRVWLSHHDGDVSIRDAQTADVITTLRPPGGRVWAMVVVSGQDGVDHVWLGLHNGDIDIFRSCSHPSKDPKHPNSVLRQASGSSYELNGKSSGVSDVADFVHHLTRHTGGILAMAEYDGYVFSGSNDFTICVWSASHFRFVKQFSGHTSYVRCLYADGSLLVSGSDDQTIRVWAVPSGALMHAGHQHQSGVSALCRSGMHMWSGDDSGLVSVWALGTYELVQTESSTHSARITVIKKVGSRVYIGSCDKKISIWDAYSRKQLRTLEDHVGWITSLLCPANLSRYFVWSASADGLVKCWHHDEYRVMNTFAERFDDVRWLYTTSPPNLAQTNALLGELQSVDRQAQEWKSEADTRRAEAITMSSEVESLRKHVASLQQSLEQQTARANTAEQTLASRTASLSNSDLELRSLQEKHLASTKELGEARAAVEAARGEAASMTRRAEVAVAEKTAAEQLCETLRKVQSNAVGGGIPILVLGTPSEAGQAMVALHKDLQSLLQLNEILREEVERYKGVLGIRTATPYPILSLTSLAMEKDTEATAAAAATAVTSSAAATTAAITTSSFAATANVGLNPSNVSSSPKLSSPVPPPVATIAPSAAPTNSSPTGSGGAAPPRRASILVPTPPPSSLPIATVATSAATATSLASPPPTAAANVPTSTIVPSVPLFAMHAAAPVQYGDHLLATARGGAQWLNPSVASYVQDRYKRRVTPLFGPTTTPPRSASPRCTTTAHHSHGSRASPRQSKHVRPATASGFGSCTPRLH